MGLMNLLGVSISIFTETYTVDINFIGKFIGILCGAAGVGVGIVLFSLILKVITLPFDVMQRITMRKQNIKMKEQQARMEKLQKQYANDKEAYNQKVMEMYKENGMSMFSSCLPMILSMVIFFIAIGAFNSYSAFANVENYNQLVGAYNSALLDKVSELDVCGYSEEFKPEYKKDENGNPTEEIISYTIVYTVKDDSANDKVLYYTVQHIENNLTLVVYNADDATKNKRLNADGTEVSADEIKAYLKSDESDKTYYINTAKIEYFAADNEVFAGYLKEVEAQKDLIKAEKPDISEQDLKEGAYKKCFQGIAQNAVVAAYKGTEEVAGVANNTKFLWIKNIWVTDAMYKHPVLEYKDFETAISTKSGCSCSTSNKAKGIEAYTKEGYNTVTAGLNKQKNDYNGYFVLIVLSIGTILLQQFVSMRAQKEQQKYSSVDGQNGNQQKMTMIMMTGMFAVFSFMYSAAFSIYLIVSNVFSLLSTIVINKIVDKNAAKKDAKKAEAKFESRYGGRVAKAREAGKASAKASKSSKSVGKKDEKKKK